MKFVADKNDLLNGIRIVERATVVKGLQPVLANVLICPVFFDIVTYVDRNN